MRDIGLTRVRSMGPITAAIERAGGSENLFVNIATTAKLIAAGALAREESRGGHFRSDFPEPREIWRHRTFLTLADAEKISAEVSSTSKSTACL